MQVGKEILPFFVGTNEVYVFECGLLRLPKSEQSQGWLCEKNIKGLGEILFYKAIYKEQANDWFCLTFEYLINEST